MSGRCPGTGPVTGWQCSRIGRHLPPHRARDPRAKPLVVKDCIVDVDGGAVTAEEWED